DVVSTRRVRELAANASTAFIPQCGLAPGFVSIVAFDMAKGFEVLDSVRLRVGALPQYPSNAINYNLTWSTDGVINEYCEACEARCRRWRSGRNFRSMALPTRHLTLRAASGPFATPSKGRSALSITARFAILAMRRSCVHSSTICACAIAGMC